MSVGRQGRIYALGALLSRCACDPYSSAAAPVRRADDSRAVNNPPKMPPCFKLCDTNIPGD